MNDRELLELAAKAAGVCLHPESALTHEYGNWGCDTTCTICGKDPSDARWRPLTDDGDALRLAVKLRLDIVDLSDCVEVNSHDNRVCTNEMTNEGQDHYAATRRAIVSAAATVGKEM